MSVSCLLNVFRPESHYPLLLDAVTVVTKEAEDKSLDDTEALWKVTPSVKIHINIIQEGEGVTRRKNAVCVKPIYNEWNLALRLVEFLEMYRLQGADHFIFYNHSVGPEASFVSKLTIQFQTLQRNLCLMFILKSKRVRGKYHISAPKYTNSF